jgi:FkbM family methyltransferase
VLAYFDSYFGPKGDRKDVCAFGFEPNMRWVQRLKKLEGKFNGAGFGTVIFSETAVGIKNGNVTFYIDEAKGKLGGKDHNNWGSSMFKWNKDGMREEKSGLLDVVSFIEHEVLRRPGQTASSKVFIKMDVEGAEYEILPAMMKTPVFCDIDAIVAEFHPYFVKGAMLKKHYLSYLDTEIGKRPGCKVKILSLDDESYVNAPED